MNNKVKKLYDEICQYETDRSLEDNIKHRLEKSLKLYLSEISNASERVQGKNTRVVYKELVR